MFILPAAFTANAQTSVSAQTAYNADSHNSFDVNSYENGKRLEKIQTDWNNKTYKMVLVNDKMTELYVDDAKIAVADWDKYSDAIAAIHIQLKRNREQAKKNEEQARLNELQAKKNEEQARENELQAKKNEEKNISNQQQVQVNELQAKKNQEQAQLNEAKAKQGEEQVRVNEMQAKKNEEQAHLNELQAKKNEEQAAENERMIQELTDDLVSDKIIPDKNSLREFTMSDDQMTVNGIKQPADVLKKYKDKYSRLSNGVFSFSRDGIIKGN